VNQDRIALSETPGLGPGQVGLFAVTDLAPSQCYLRFVNVTVDAVALQQLIGDGILSGLSVMDETRKYKSLALGPGRLLNVSFSTQSPAANAEHHCQRQSMAWLSELEGSEFQTMFISHIHATERVRAGKEILVNYGQSYCEQLVRLMR
jgi:hypothetical protein